jgi:hypothetical protein
MPQAIGQCAFRKIQTSLQKIQTMSPPSLECGGLVYRVYPELSRVASKGRRFCARKDYCLDKTIDIAGKR